MEVDCTGLFFTIFKCVIEDCLLPLVKAGKKEIVIVITVKF